MSITSAYGVPGLTGVELALMLNTLRINYGMVKGQSLTQITNRESAKVEQPVFPVVFSSVPVFLRTQGKFKTARVIAFITDNPVVLTKNLGVPLLGAEYQQKHTLVFTRLTEDCIKQLLVQDSILTEGKVFTDLKYKPVEETLKKYKQSDLSHLQTFLYKIKELDTRDKVSILTKDWLLTLAPFSKIEGKLQRHLKPAIASTLKTMLTMPSVDNLKLAISKVRSHKFTLAKAAKVYKVSSFDLRFLLAVRK